MFQNQIIKCIVTKKITHIIIPLFLMMFYSLNGQDNFQEGYIILKNNDTVYGGIKDRNIFTGELFDKIKFKKKGKTVKRYTAHDILGYSNGDNDFESVWYYEEGDFLNTYFHASPRYGEKAFLIVHSKGPLNFYSKKFTVDDSSYPDSFPLFKREGDSYYIRATQGVLGLKKKRLAGYFYDCPALAKKIKDKTVKESYKVVDFYNNNCAN